MMPKGVVSGFHGRVGLLSVVVVAWSFSVFLPAALAQGGRAPPSNVQRATRRNTPKKEEPRSVEAKQFIALLQFPDRGTKAERLRRRRLTELSVPEHGHCC